MFHDHFSATKRHCLSSVAMGNVNLTLPKLAFRGIYSEAANTYSGALFIAEDFDRYNLAKNGNFRLVER